MRVRLITGVLGIAGLLMLAGCGGDALAPGAETPDPKEAQITEEMIPVIQRIMTERAEDGRLLRLNQTKTLGCLAGEFTVPADLAPALRRGLFAEPGTYPVTARFANASEFDDSKKDFRGLSLKVRDVEGESLWGESGTQDFLLNSHAALFAADSAEFLAFLEATADGSMWKFFVNPLHWDALLVILRGRDEITDPLAIRYWSTTPFRFGSDDDVAVKYSMASCDSEVAAEGDGENRLIAGMQKHLENGGACFDFMIQFQDDPADMPIEDASVIWDEQASPFQSVARITFPDQNFRSPEKVADCEAETFNPWQSLEAHQPLGGINRVRRAVYAEIGRFRTAANSE